MQPAECGRVSSVSVIFAAVAEPRCDDAVKNGRETDVDCGPGCPPVCGEISRPSIVQVAFAGACVQQPPAMMGSQMV